MAVRLRVHVTPRSGRDIVSGWRGDELAIRVTVPPEGGKANAAVCALIARELGIPKSSVDVVVGTGSRHKQIAIEGVTQARITDAFGEPGV